jgi:hypothetical protein
VEGGCHGFSPPVMLTWTLLPAWSRKGRLKSTTTYYDLLKVLLLTTTYNYLISSNYFVCADPTLQELPGLVQ